MADSKKKNTRSSGKNVGRDQIISAANGSVAFEGSVNNSQVFAIGNHRLDTAYKFASLFPQIENLPNLSTVDKSDLKAELKTFEDEDKKGPESNEGFLAQRLRSIRRISPDFLEVVIATITNPAAGFGTIAKKVAEKMKTESK